MIKYIYIIIVNWDYQKVYFQKKYNISVHGIQYLCCLIDKHGFDILRTQKNKYYPKYIKQDAIDSVLIHKEAIWAVSLDIGLLGDGMLHSWIKKYYNIVERKRGRFPDSNYEKRN